MAGTLTVQNLQGPSSGANANKIIVPSGQTIDASAGTLVPSSGQIIQTVQFLREGSTGSNSSSAVSISSATYTDVMSKAITTKVANSKIRVMINTVTYRSGGTNMRGAYKVLRDSTQIDGDLYGFYTSTSNNMLSAVVDHIDSPNAAAGTVLTYKFQGSSRDAVSMQFLYSDGGGAASNSITLQEIAP